MFVERYPIAILLLTPLSIANLGFHELGGTIFMIPYFEPSSAIDSM